MNVKMRGTISMLPNGAKRIMRKSLRALNKQQLNDYLQTGNEDELFQLTYCLGKTNIWKWD